MVADGKTVTEAAKALGIARASDVPGAGGRVGLQSAGDGAAFGPPFSFGRIREVPLLITAI
jgi:hypothetical protein